MSKGTIVCIDDEYGHMDFYWAALELAEYDVVQLTSADEALEYIQSLRAGGVPDPALIVFDLMMPPGTKLTDQETEFGSRTGAALAWRLDRYGILSRVPVFSLSSDSSLDIVLPAQVARFYKHETSPASFAEAVDSRLMMNQDKESE